MEEDGAGRGWGGARVSKCKCVWRPLLQIKCQDVKYCQFHFAARGMTNPYSSLNKTLTAAEGGRAAAVVVVATVVVVWGGNHGRTKRHD